MLVKALIVCVLIAFAETIHGILRVMLLNRRLGDRRARQIAVFTGSALIFIIGWASMAWIGPDTIRDCLIIGLIWFVFMLSFDLGLGRFYFGFPWKRLLADFDPRQGGMLGFGMAILFITPLAVAKLKGII